ncbi:conserved hypothetical protein [Pyrenophora tritici-repentis Pt-1C-BFP]|uniref:Uncharacterized protein n=1 Tax=Pyrenophora tritici-repentis (strain Pt-1C-BFP) TaxID=426418 RepID=B2WL00_PYRTR|nr:uncharacterized protein PTRG_10660 [Pyrenophora tritici-repentis Pt-1C-BFP]EDU43710.1 conserved hypothetical protein [Pyrenophora tritici-repentis Pt-1C-BFP]
MKLTVAVAAVFIVCSVVARVVKVQLIILYLAHGTFHVLAMRSLNGPRPKVAFWDDPASPEDWQKYTAKGGALMCGLEGSDQTAGRLMGDTRQPPSAASKFNGDLQTELQDWYWRPVHPATYSCSISQHWQIPHAVESLGLSGTSKAQGGDNECFRTEHWDPERRDDDGNQIPAVNQRYTVPGYSKQYRATKAHYEFGVNTKAGAIHGIYLEGPQASAKGLWGKLPKKDELPELRAFSDVIWGYWNRNNPDIKNIRYFFMVGISNDLMNELIASSLTNKKARLAKWPGTEFSTATDEGHALLGSPNGAAFAYFLMQHKAQLGQKTITKITVFRPDNDDDLDFVDASLVFHVEDGPEPPPDAMAGTDTEDAHIVRKSTTANVDNKDVVQVHEVYM